MNRLQGYLTKQEIAARFGVAEKTIDRRRKTDPLLKGWIKVGKRVWFPQDEVEQYFRQVEKRGYL